MTPADSETDYAYWTAPGKPVTVTYSLAVFHEIEFQASEGFRRIPHGGVETGGLLFGRLEQSSAEMSVRIEAFRSIESEHALGPSFNLSERDVAAVREQLAAAASDFELQGLEALGWFVAHTRNPLQMNDREAVLFGQLFPGPGRILLLVKPERFQATRFAFVVRDADGRVEADVAASAIILPLPGRSGRSTPGPAASIPAPLQSVRPPPQPPAPTKEEVRAPSTPSWVALPETSGQAETPPVPEEAGRSEVPVASEVPVVYEAPADSEPLAPSFWRAVAPELPGSEPILRIEEPPVSEELEATARTMIEAARPAGALLALEEIKRRRSENLQSTGTDGAPDGREKITRKIRREERPSLLRLASLLVLASAMGCGVGYLSYLQLPSTTVALTVRPQPGSTPASTLGLLISWPAEQTRDALFASIRVDDADATPLSAEQKTSGRVLIPVRSDNVKIELITQRRWRGSRGIVRYARAKSMSP